MKETKETVRMIRTKNMWGAAGVEEEVGEEAEEVKEEEAEEV